MNERELSEERRRVVKWMLLRKIEAGLITAEAIDQIDKISHACSVLVHAHESLLKSAQFIAEACKLPVLAKAISDKDNAATKRILSHAQNADAVSQSAVMFLVQVQEELIEADLKLQSTSWLSDSPPEINIDELENELKRRREEMQKYSTGIAEDLKLATKASETTPVKNTTSADVELVQKESLPLTAESGKRFTLTDEQMAEVAVVEEPSDSVELLKNELNTIKNRRSRCLKRVKRAKKRFKLLKRTDTSAEELEDAARNYEMAQMKLTDLTKQKTELEERIAENSN